MNRNLRRFILVSALMMFTAMMFSAAPALAQSITVLNQTNCIQWIQVKDTSGKSILACALTPNAHTARNAGGEGIGRIEAGPTKSVDACCYKRRINASPNLSGKTWRIEIQPSLLRVIDGDQNWKEAFSGSGNFSSCDFGMSTMGAGGGPGSGEVPRN